MIIGILSFLSTLLASIAAWKSYSVSRDSKNYEKRMDEIKLKPQLYLKKYKEQYADYVLIGDLEKEDLPSYSSPEIILTNISDSMILDLNVDIKVDEDETYTKLIHEALSENDGNITKEGVPDEEWGGDIAWDYHRPLMKKNNFEKDILLGNEECHFKLPDIFTATLKGVNHLRRNGEDFDNLELHFKIKISYKHAFSNNFVRINENLVLNFDCTNKALQGPIVRYNSIIFEKK